MTPISGWPEGRPGIWLIGPYAAARLIDAVPGETVHNFIGEGVLCGANWSKEDAKELVLLPGKKLGLIFPPNLTGSHQLVVLDEKKRWCFDVGEIAEERMTME